MNEKWQKHSEDRLTKMVADIIKEIPMPSKIGGVKCREDLAGLKKAGSEIWLDTGDRDNADKNWCAEITGLTTNNTLANQVVQKGVFDSVIAKSIDAIRSGAPSLSKEDLVIETGFVVNAAISKSLVSEFGVKVSVELHPAIADDVEATVMFGKRYFALDPKNFFVKVPLTPAGVISVRKMIEAGVKINFTLGFSARQNHLLARISKPTLLNVFLGRDNQVVIENNLGDGSNVGEKATLATQNDMLEARKSGATDTRLIAASLRSPEQILTLAGVDVLTIPPGVMEKFYAMNLSAAKIKADLGANLKVDVKDKLVNVLWEIPDPFEKMVAKLAGQNVSAMQPQELVKFAQENGVADLFGNYKPEDLATIKKTGKIPKLAQWTGRGFALDDLLTVSALESFVSDQEALDARIAGFIKN